MLNIEDLSNITKTPFTIQPVVKRVWQPVLQPCWTNSCSFNRLSNRVVQRVWQPVVSCIQTFTRLVWQPVWQQVVSCKRGLTHVVLNSTWPLSQSVRHACMTMTILDAVPFLFHFAYLFQVCTLQNKTNYHPHCRRFLPYSITGCDAVWWKSSQHCQAIIGYTITFRIFGAPMAEYWAHCRYPEEAHILLCWTT